MKSNDWMWELATHYEQMRRAYPDDQLCVVFDIDGTILDMRYMIVSTLLRFDRVHNTDHFRGLGVDDVDVHETKVEDFLIARGLPERLRADILGWYLAQMWSPETVLAGTRPFRGVMSVIRWFQLQPNTVIALNTGRPEALRELTLSSLNSAGETYRVTFESQLLRMNPRDWGEAIETGKVDALDDLRALGMRIVAVVDNEPVNLAAMAEADATHEVLFLHADTIFESQRQEVPRSYAGSEYALSGLIREADLRGRVEFIWHGVNDEANLRQFLSSDMRWAECDVRVDPRGRLVLRHDTFEDTPWTRSEHPFTLEDCLPRIVELGRAIAIDLKEGGAVIDEVLQRVANAGLPPQDVSFMGSIEALKEDGIREVRSRMPEAHIAVQIDFVAPLILAAPSLADQVLNELRAWGVSSVSLGWTTLKIRTLLDELERRVWPVNVFGVGDLEAFLEAALLLPRSVIADFNFPDWNYFGRGSGQNRAYHQYGLLPPQVTAGA